MPRSKNPNPRQVMEENGTGGKPRECRVTDRDKDDAEADLEAGAGTDFKDCTSNAPRELSCTEEKSWSSDEAIGRKDLHAATSGIISACGGDDDALSGKCLDSFQAGGCNFKSEASESDDLSQGDLQIKPKTSFSFSPSSPPSFFAISPITSSRPSKSNGLHSNAQNDGRKAKCNSPSTLNPNVMTWMRNRFQMRPGGRISASDIIALYESDTKHLEIPPPGLQNYQVGQLLRRVFPSITRCKITVNGKRHWVYKHLNLMKNPLDDLFEDQKSPASVPRGSASPATEEMPEDVSRSQESPVSNFEEGDIGNETNSPSPLSATEDVVEDEERRGLSSNAILLGLLGRKIKREGGSPPPVSANSLELSKGEDTLVNGEVANFLPKKKRDSEVIQWLRENYKIKPGYYVKSMDLLRKYNNGRAEMVKYLSQVGRVMKNVFPSVRHLRKSFKGGKREWVYLNLKPVDVDSDSEEGKSMLMPTMRRSLGWSGNVTRSSESMDLDSRDDRLNVTGHCSLPSSQPSETVFKSTAEMFHRISRTDGNKLVIRRSQPHCLENRADSAKTVAGNCIKSETMSGDSVLSRTVIEKPGKKKRIILYNKPDAGRSRLHHEAHVPVELERDIFAPINRARQMLSGPSHTQFHDQKDNFDYRCKTDVETPPGGHLVAIGELSSPQEAKSELVCDGQGATVLDLTIKTKTSYDPPGVEVEGQDPLNLTLSTGSQVTTSMVVSDVEVESSPTIHYRPANVKSLESSTASDMHPIVSSSSSNLRNLQTVDKILSIKRKYLEVNGTDAPISWQSLQSFSAQRYGWLRSPDSTIVARTGGSHDGKAIRFVEWFLFSGQWLVNKQRALREIKIYEDWTVAIHALGRRVYPNDLGGITDLEKTTTSLNKVFRVLAEAKLCMGFPAPSVSDLYIHGILVSKFEVWSSREGSGEDIRQRAVNCQILYSGLGNCCNKCARILKLHQQQSKGQSVKRPYPDHLVNTNYLSKKAKI